MNNSIKVSTTVTPEHMLEDLTTIINDSVVEGKDSKIIIHVKGIVVFDFTKEPTTTAILQGIERG